MTTAAPPYFPYPHRTVAQMDAIARTGLIYRKPLKEKHRD